MNINDIRNLYAYNRWANDRMFLVLERLTPEQFTATHVSSFPSIRESVFHILAAEWVWLKRWKGTSPRASGPVSSLQDETWRGLRAGGEAPPQELGTVAALKAFGEALDQERNELLAALTDERLLARLAYTDMSGNPFSQPLANLMQHVVNHGTYHRGQVTTLLCQAGADTIALDLVYFFRETEEKAASNRG